MPRYLRHGVDSQCTSSVRDVRAMEEDHGPSQKARCRPLTALPDDIQCVHGKDDTSII